MEEDDIEKKDKRNRSLIYSWWSFAIHPHTQFYNNGTKKACAIFIVNMLFFYLFAEKITIPNQVQDWLWKYNFLIPNIEEAISSSSIPKQFRFGFTFFWLVWGVNAIINCPIFLIRNKKSLILDIKATNTFFKKRGKVTNLKAKLQWVFMIITAYGFIFFAPYMLILKGEGVDIWIEYIYYIPVMVQTLIVGYFWVIRWFGIHMVVFFVYYLYYSFFRKKRKENI